MGFFISNAIADTTSAAAPQSDGVFSLVMVAAIFVLFYFMLIRPQSKRAKQHKELVGNLKKGDEIVTAGGILGKIVNLDEQYIRIQASQGVEITMQRGSVVTVLPKGTIESV
ncbi:MAG: preprotein translocase subunit YajC [Legionellales bacterium RIFCSPHIGHO2_12_FULL_35_11]|nr:MAG: preprotein translocase subunit YajC [Legionellales bacterium RIFCSPHIGHO2_12_FULL_35_11]